MTRALTAAAALLATLAVTASATAKLDSGVKGRVTVSPTCPVEPYPPDPSCAPRGYQTTIRIRTLPDRKPVKTIRTGKKGGFRTALKPGSYRLRAHGGDGGLPACGPVDVKVDAHGYTRADIACDSGIR
jgi:hypothetical protein